MFSGEVSYVDRHQDGVLAMLRPAACVVLRAPLGLKVTRT